MSREEVVKTVRQNKSFLITSHINLEPDALGSELAVLGLLKIMGKKARILNQDKSPREYGFLPGINKIKTKLGRFSFEVVIVVDCSDITRCGEVSKLFTNDKIIVNIDHHISNTYFADVNWVKPRASSTVEMIYDLYKRLHVPLDKNIALNLYAGLLTDTGSFHYPNTTFYSHTVAADLLRYGIQPNEIYKNVYQSNSFEDIKLLAKVLPLIKRDCEGRLIWYTIPRSILKNKRSTFDLTEHVLGFARLIKGLEIAVLFKENLGAVNQIKVNFRSQGKYDVNRIASYFGGGGHRTASACTIRGSLNEVSKKVLNKIKGVLKCATAY